MAAGTWAHDIFGHCAVHLLAAGLGALGLGGQSPKGRAFRDVNKATIIRITTAGIIILILIFTTTIFCVGTVIALHFVLVRRKRQGEEISLQPILLGRVALKYTTEYRLAS